MTHANIVLYSNSADVLS